MWLELAKSSWLRRPSMKAKPSHSYLPKRPLFAHTLRNMSLFFALCWAFFAQPDQMFVLCLNSLVPLKKWKIGFAKKKLPKKNCLGIHLPALFATIFEFKKGPFEKRYSIKAALLRWKEGIFSKRIQANGHRREHKDSIKKLYRLNV